MKGMPKNFINYFSIGVALSLSVALPAQELSVVRLANDQLELRWKKDADGYTLETLKVKGSDGWNSMETANYQHNVLYATSKPGTTSQKLYDNTGKEILFPAPQYRYIIPSWQQNTNAVALNKAGENLFFHPSSVKRISDTELCFRYEDETMRITEKWCLDPVHQNDIKVDFILYPKRDGYYSLATPSLVSIDKYNFQWATVPGIFQGNAINTDFVQAYGYGQGIPDVPVVARERTASTLSALITDKKGVTVAVTAEPGTGRGSLAEG